LRTAKSSLSFYAPDELIRHPLEADLLMVDEAAAIPGQLLSQLLDRYSKVVFATTVHGYEGSGRGFELRFSRVLDLKRPAWKKLRMSQPVRWAEHDPLEALSFRALLMDASPTSSSELQGLTPEGCRCEHVNRDLLVNDESSLKDLFGLLVTAHYRTRPFDLRYLLDAPNASLYVLRWGGHIVATAMLAREGSFDDTMAQSIYAGLRRPRGHLLAQSLSAHVGVELAAAKSFMRVVRIAVHPEFQGRGLGSALLEGIVEDVKAQGVDAIGASFAADTEVLRFWHRSDFHAVHLGMSQEHTSGNHSVMMLRPLSPTGQALCTEARQRFAARLRVLLNDVLAGLDQSLRHQLIDGLPSPAMVPDTEHELLAYAFARRGFEVSLYAIQPFIQDLFKRSLLEHLDPRQRTLLELRVLRHVDWKGIVKLLDLSGKREAQDLMRQTLAQLIDQTGSARMLRYRDVLKELEGEVEASTG
jgi:tRNA(Met) cytidine acetyltransferase